MKILWQILQMGCNRMENDESQNLQRDFVYVSFVSALVAQAGDWRMSGSFSKTTQSWLLASTGEVNEG